MKKKNLQTILKIDIFVVSVYLMLLVMFNLDNDTDRAFEMFINIYVFIVLIIGYAAKNMVREAILLRYTRRKTIIRLIVTFSLMVLVSLLVYFIADKLNLLTDSFLRNNFIEERGFMGYAILYSTIMFLVGIGMLITIIEFNMKTKNLIRILLASVVVLFLHQGLVLIPKKIEPIVLGALIGFTISIYKEVIIKYTNANYQMVIDNSMVSYASR
ncbi:hypothetical protein [Haploplasma axanthum]|uniref:Uncharacterized protein n=1 Tax=Haploplasma axanthum TaxID=29552 RepID=A0A449BBZ2_HAPAX|nr:hypothetical protein [Haploplasma axanthum]VEU79956.1 Uncharacterised protein [Haploplasma axanthum]